jgi:hypothetical protein
VTELSAYQFSALRDGPFTLSRGLGDGLAPILLVTRCRSRSWSRDLRVLQRKERRPQARATGFACRRRQALPGASSKGEEGVHDGDVGQCPDEIDHAL